MKNSNDTIGHRTRDLPACTVVSEPAAPLRYTPPPNIERCATKLKLRQLELCGKKTQYLFRTDRVGPRPSKDVVAQKEAPDPAGTSQPKPMAVSPVKAPLTDTPLCYCNSNTVTEISTCIPCHRTFCLRMWSGSVQNKLPEDCAIRDFAACVRYNVTMHLGTH
jgi:hypothetical protein